MTLDVLLATFGRAHPMVLHLPIGLFFALAAMELLALARRTPLALQTRAALAWLAAFAAVFTATTGFFLGQETAYSGDTVDLHRYLGIAVAVIAVLVAVLQRRVARQPLGRGKGAAKAYAAALIVCIGVLVPAGHFGATLTHGGDFLFEPYYVSKATTPTMPLRGGARSAGPATVPISHAQTTSTFDTTIAPIFANYCISCHGAEKHKGGLSLHTREGILADSSLIVANNAAESELMRRLHLPADDEDHMPPGSKKQPSKSEIGAIEAWINNGASFDEHYTQMDGAAGGTGAAASEGASGAIAESERSSAAQPPSAAETIAASRAIPAAKPEAVAALRAAHLYVAAVRADDALLLIDFSAAPPLISDAQVAELLVGLREQAADVSLARLRIGRKTMSVLGSAPNLTRVNAAASALTDGDLALLAGHPTLSELVLSGTKLTDSAVTTLLSLPALARLYLWKSGISAEAIAGLRRDRPGLAIDTGEAAPREPLAIEDKPNFTSDRPPPGVAAAPPTAAAAPAVLHAINTICPVSGKPGNDRYVILYEGKLIGFCCEKCGAAFWEDPKKYKLP